MKHSSTHSHESSFTLLETIIALGLMVTVVLEVSSILGKSITFNEYNRSSSQAIWLAQAVMSKVEWYASYYDFKEIKMDSKELEFDESLCPKDPKFGGCEFKYDLKIEEFPLPIVDLISGRLGGGDSEVAGGDSSDLGSAVESTVKNFLGEELLKLAHVEVHWPEGSRRNSVELAYLLTNQKKLDEQVFTQKPLGKKPAKKNSGSNNPGQPSNSQGSGSNTNNANNGIAPPGTNAPPGNN